MEIWKQIASHPKYEASSEGRIRRLKTGFVLKPRFQVNGYLRVNIDSLTELVH